MNKPSTETFACRFPGCGKSWAEGLRAEYAALQERVEILKFALDQLAPRVAAQVTEG